MKLSDHVCSQEELVGEIIPISLRGMGSSPMTSDE